MHEPVLLDEVIDFLDVKEGGAYIDGTVGSGGHAEAILNKMGEDGFLLGLDRDEDAVGRAKQRLNKYGEKADVVKGNYADIKEISENKGLKRANGVLLDLGVSSEQLDEAARGFSFRFDGPLDMRMDRGKREKAEDLVNGGSRDELADVFRKFGEERKSAVIASAIVRERAKGPITTTGRLAAIIEKAVGGRRGKTHPATRSFQALRIFVNAELEHLLRGLSGGLDVLAEGGRMVVISYHSLEDRIVKNFFREHAGRWQSLQAGGREWHGSMPKVKIITRKPVAATGKELERNSRARSAKLRAAERLKEEG